MSSPDAGGSHDGHGEPGNAWVRGQRRRSDGSFPSGGGGYFEPPTGPVPIGVEDGEPEQAPPTDQCADPDTALEWNADAAAAEALRRFQADAGDPLVDRLERSFVIYRDPATGGIRLGNIAVGPNMGGAVTPDMTGIDMRDVIGTIHSHPGNGPYPSDPDRSNFTNFWQKEIGEAGGDAARFRVYVVGTRADPGGSARLQIRVYNQTNLDGDEANPGPEVNPNGELCP